jgi:hypothetical protein
MNPIEWKMMRPTEGEGREYIGEVAGTIHRATRGRGMMKLSPKFNI